MALICILCNPTIRDKIRSTHNDGNEDKDSLPDDCMSIDSNAPTAPPQPSKINLIDL